MKKERDISKEIHYFSRVRLVHIVKTTDKGFINHFGRNEITADPVGLVTAVYGDNVTVKIEYAFGDVTVVVKKSDLELYHDEYI